MRENKHSKKLAFAVLAATAAVGVSAVAPVSAASINTADGLIVTSDTPVSSNVAVPTTVVTGSGNIAVGQQNEVRSTSGSTSAFGNQNYVNGQDANALVMAMQHLAIMHKYLVTQMKQMVIKQ